MPGSLRYTVYRGTNLLRQEAIAKTDAPSVAYKYVGGLKGFAIAGDTKIVWRDVARAWQQYAFGGSVNTDPVAVKARNRLGIVETGGGSLAFLPASHKFFFAREIETNLGFVYYRKDSETSFAVGVRQADREEPYRPYGVSDEEWNKRASEARHDINNFALYNAPPGTWQRMPVYFYLSPEDGRATQQAVMAFTHDDRYKEMPGYQVLVSHFHMHFNEQLTDAGSEDVQPSWLQVFRGLGINIAILADFHSDSHPNDPGPHPLRRAEGLFRRLPPLPRQGIPADSGRRAGRHPRRSLHYVPAASPFIGRMYARRGSSSSTTIPNTARCTTSGRLPKSSICCAAKMA